MNSLSPQRKIRIVRVVTASYVVPWHLENTLKRLPGDFEVCVIGEGVSRYREAYPDVKWVDIDIKRKLSPVFDFLALLRLCHFFLTYKPDIAHSIMHKAALLTAVAGFICRVPIRINTFTGQYWATKQGLPRALYYASDWLTNALDNICLTDSPSQSEFLLQQKISKNGKPLPVLLKGSLSGVDMERFDPQKLSMQARHFRKELGLDSTHFIFLYLARKTADKGALDILKAFEAVSQTNEKARLLFVGPDESDGEINQLCDNRPGIFSQVINIDRSVSNRELYLAVSDVLCLPSYKEGFGSIVVEAAALGVPTIGTRIPGLVDSVEDGKTGILFPVGDVDALAETMMHFMSNREEYAHMQEASVKRVQSYFTADLIYDALKSLYQKAIDDASARNPS